MRALWLSGLCVRVPGCQKLQMTAQPGMAQDAPIAVPVWQQWVSKAQRVNVWQPAVDCDTDDYTDNYRRSTSLKT